MSLLPSFARMTIWFIPWADPLLQTVLELPPADGAGARWNDLHTRSASFDKLRMRRILSGTKEVSSS